METLQLSEPEQRYYSDLFLLCSINPDNSSSVPIIKACELFRTSKLPNDVLRQITDVCSGSKSSELFRKEFYMALKLIAAAQAGLVVSTEIVANGVEVPLPKFTWPSDEPTDLIQLTEGSTAPTIGRTSPSASSTASDSPTPTNSVQDKLWAATSAWQGIVCEEQRQLLGTEEESSDRHSSSEEGVDASESVLTMTEEQRAYYTQQYHTLQPKPNHTLPGPVARLFFEKSRLPVHELRQIWQLADVTKDGALSLEEFNVAMHLVVLRRNDIPLPETLPPSLMPLLPSSPTSPACKTALSPQSKTSSKQWTKFVDSPTSSIASPGPKPVNFDFHKSAVEQDPKIFHPVAVRVTPEQPSNPTTSENDQTDVAIRNEADGTNGATKRVLLQSYSADSGGGDVIRPIQRPTPRKPHPHPQPGALPPPPHSAIDDASGPTSLPVMGPKKDPPPPPPPRPYRTHGRSSSLDLNHIGRSASLQAPPAPPPRISPNSTSPHKLRCEDEAVISSEAEPRRHGAFQVYRKNKEAVEPEPEAGGSDSISKLELQKAGLTQLCQQMQQELVSLQEERCLLQAKLDQLHATYDA